MEEKSGSTPNPLNPTPQSPQNITASQAPKENLLSKPSPAPKADSIPTPIPEPVVTETPVTAPNQAVVSADNNAPVDDSTTPDPMSRPMEQAPTTSDKPNKQKKTGLIIGAIVCLFVAIGCGVTAALLFLAPKADPVVAALDKLFARETMPNLSIKGNFDIKVNDSSNQWPNINLSIDSSIVSNSTINSTDLIVTASARDGEQMSFKVSEMYTNSGDLYLKLDGITDFLESIWSRENAFNQDDIEDFEIEEDTSITVEESENLDVEAEGANLAEVLEGEWLRISSDELSEYVSIIPIDTSAVTCLTNSVKKINAKSNTISKIYQDNSFISSTDKNVQIASRNYPARLINIDGEKLAGFINELNSTDIVKDLSSCFGSTENTINSDGLADLINSLPDIYVEINADNDFSRIYFATPINDGSVTLTTDIDLSYPNTINITEPVEYQDLSTILQNNITTFESVDLEESTEIQQ